MAVAQNSPCKVFLYTECHGHAFGDAEITDALRTVCALAVRTFGVVCRWQKLNL